MRSLGTIGADAKAKSAVNASPFEQVAPSSRLNRVPVHSAGVGDGRNGIAMVLVVVAMSEPTLPLGPGSYRLIVTGRSYEEPGVVAHGSAVAQFSHVQLENPTVTFVTCRATPASCTRWPNCCMA